MSIQEIKQGDLYLFAYEDAAHSYRNITDEQQGMPSITYTVGKVRRIENDFVDIGLTWLPQSEVYKDGIVIPKKAIIEVSALYQK